MSKIKSFFLTEQTPRWQIMLGGLVVIAAGFVQNEINYSRTTAKNAAMAHEQRVETRVAEIQKHSIDFQTYAGAFVSSVLDRSEDIE